MTKMINEMMTAKRARICIGYLRGLNSGVTDGVFFTTGS
jgi:hypothetical protein